MYLKLSAHGTALSQLIVSGFGHTRRLLEHLHRGVDWDDCGVLQLAFNAKEAERQAQLAAAFPEDLLHMLDQPQAEVRAGIALEHGWPVLPRRRLGAPARLVPMAGVRTRTYRCLPHHDVLELREVDGQWQAWDGERLLAECPGGGAGRRRRDQAFPLQQPSCHSNVFVGKSPDCRKPRKARR